jgi:tRNA dimethylallyltransferase
MSKNKPKIIAIVGPNASGKSELAVKLAKHLSNLHRMKSNESKYEIISADSRQVYKGMDIGTGKVPRDLPNNQRIKTNLSEYLYRGIPHHLLDVASPKRTFSVTQYKKLAEKAIKKILKKKKIPILCGGTGFYIQAVVDNISFPKVKPDWQLRKKLEKKSTKELFEILKKLDPKRAQKIDKNNPRRLIRAIEIVKKTKKPVPEIKKESKYDVLMIGIKKEKEELKKLIEKRLKKRLKQGMIKEVEKLHNNGISWKKLESFGLEYKWVAKYLQNQITKKELADGIQKESEQYAKRQITWFKRDKRIAWIKNYKEAEKLVKDFL